MLDGEFQKQGLYRETGKGWRAQLRRSNKTVEKCTTLDAEECQNTEKWGKTMGGIAIDLQTYSSK